MKKSLLEIYALVMCFASGLVMLFGLIAIINNVAGLEAPSVMMDSFTHRNVATNDAYWQTRRQQGFDNATKTFPARPPEAVLTGERLDALAQAEDEVRRMSLQNLIKAIGSTVLGAVFFGFHWLIAKRQRERDGKAAA